MEDLIEFLKHFDETLRFESFVSLDVEMANSKDLTSLIQIGCIQYSGGPAWIERKAMNRLVRYVGEFDWYASKNIHGIRKRDVLTAASSETIYRKFKDLADHAGFIIHYSGRERQVMNALSDKYGIPRPKAKWLDLHKAVKRRFPEFRNQGGGLKSIAGLYGFPLDHHDAYSDAQATARVFMHLLEDLTAHQRS